MGRPRRATSSAPASVLDVVPACASALTTAQRLTERAARAGFGWSDLAPIWAKVQEELDELRAEIRGGDRGRAAAELGDVLFSVVNLARWLDADAEAALRATNAKFRCRFGRIEESARRRGRPLTSLRLAEMERLWRRAKTLA